LYFARVIVVAVVVVVGTARVLSDVLAFKGARICFKNMCTTRKTVVLYVLKEWIDFQLNGML
jgi:hypothetical protein